MREWLATLRLAALRVVIDETVEQWERPDLAEYPGEDFGSDPNGTIVYHAAANKLAWIPGGGPKPEHAIDAMLFVIGEPWRSNPDGTTRTRLDEVDLLRGGRLDWRRDIVDLEAVRGFIEMLGRSSPEVFEGRISAEHEMAALCMLAERGDNGVPFEAMVSKLSERARASGSSWTPLMAAANFGGKALSERLVKRLLPLCDRDAADSKGRTAADIADEALRPGLAKKIRESAGATRGDRPLLRAVSPINEFDNIVAAKPRG
jgi:hypothetical protein